MGVKWEMGAGHGERVKIEGVEREGVWKRVSSHTHIGMLHSTV